MRGKKIHNLKIKDIFEIDLLNGSKNFEIRFNDRDFQYDDIVTFVPAGKRFWYDSILGEKFYKITFITDYEQKPGYVVFGIKEIK